MKFAGLISADWKHKTPNIILQFEKDSNCKTQINTTEIFMWFNLWNKLDEKRAELYVKLTCFLQGRKPT